MDTYQDEMAMVIHQGAEALHKIGAISNERMKEYDADCLAAAKSRKPFLPANYSSLCKRQILSGAEAPVTVQAKVAAIFSRTRVPITSAGVWLVASVRERI